MADFSIRSTASERESIIPVAAVGGLARLALQASKLRGAEGCPETDGHQATSARRAGALAVDHCPVPVRPGSAVQPCGSTAPLAVVASKSCAPDARVAGPAVSHAVVEGRENAKRRVEVRPITYLIYASVRS